MMYTPGVSLRGKVHALQGAFFHIYGAYRQPTYPAGTHEMLMHAYTHAMRLGLYNRTLKLRW
jgi:hypothetical protein